MINSRTLSYVASRLYYITHAMKTHSDAQRQVRINTTCLEFGGSLGPLPDSDRKSEDGLLVPL